MNDINEMGKFTKFLSVSLGVTMILLAIAATAISTGLSILFYQSLIVGSGFVMVVIGFIVILQLMVFLGSVSKGIVSKRTPQHYNTVVRFTRLCFVISVLSTTTFFNHFDKAERVTVIKELLYIIPVLGLDNNAWLVNNLTNITLIWGSCLLLDFMSMVFPTIGSDLITGISINKKLHIGEKGYFTKCWELLTFAPKNFINEKCYNHGIIDNFETPVIRSSKDNVVVKPYDKKKKLNTLQDTIRKLNTEHVTPEKTYHTKQVKDNTYHTPESKDTIQDTPLNTKHNTDTEKPVLDSVKDLNTPKENKELLDTQNNISLLHNTKHNTDTKHNTPKLNTGNEMDNETLIRNIDNYIRSEYEIGDMINVTNIKLKFGFKKNDRKWTYNIKNNLKSAKVENNRLRRVKEEIVSLAK